MPRSDSWCVAGWYNRSGPLLGLQGDFGQSGSVSLLVCLATHGWPYLVVLNKSECCECCVYIHNTAQLYTHMFMPYMTTTTTLSLSLSLSPSHTGI